MLNATRQQVFNIAGNTTADGPTALCKNGGADKQLNNTDSGSTEYVLLLEGKLRRTKSNDTLSGS